MLQGNAGPTPPDCRQVTACTSWIRGAVSDSGGGRYGAWVRVGNVRVDCNPGPDSCRTTWLFGRYPTGLVTPSAGCGSFSASSWRRGCRSRGRRAGKVEPSGAVSSASQISPQRLASPWAASPRARWCARSIPPRRHSKCSLPRGEPRRLGSIPRCRSDSAPGFPTSLTVLPSDNGLIARSLLPAARPHLFTWPCSR